MFLYKQQNEISDMLGTEHLEETEDDICTEAKGVVWGPHNRIFIATVVKIGDKMRHVHFLVNTGSPFTYMCDEVIQSFRKIVSNPHNPFSVHINGHPVLVFQSPENPNFRDMNILGTNFMKTFKCILNVNFGAETAKLTSNFD